MAYINVGKTYCLLKKNVYSTVVECSTNMNKVNYLINLFKFSICYRFLPVKYFEISKYDCVFLLLFCCFCFMYMQHCY